MNEKLWKTAPCGTGPGCWCSLVATEDYTGEGDSEIVVGSGSIGHDLAEEIVYYHNLAISNGASFKEYKLKKIINDYLVQHDILWHVAKNNVIHKIEDNHCVADVTGPNGLIYVAKFYFSNNKVTQAEMPQNYASI